MRRKLLEDLYDKMSEEDKKLFVQMTMQDKQHSEIMHALQGVRKDVEDNKHSFASDLAANVAGNAIFDSFVYLGAKLIKKL